ncbi:sodium:solute symporter family protein [bacterium]|nr:sodium:solute symporter family protein [bacterium]
MNSLLFISMFSILGIIYFFLGIYASKSIKTTADYFLAGRNLGFIPVTLTLIATQLGGGMLLGTSAEAYNVGYYGLLYTIGMSMGFILLGLGFAAKLQSLNVATTAELFETRYSSPSLKKVASFLSIITLCGILIGQIVAARSLMLGLGINSELILILFWIGVIAYTMVGGLKAVIITDTFQVGFILLIFAGIFVYALFNEPGSFFSFANIVQQQKLFSDVSFSALFGVALMPALFSLIEQDLAQRFFAARTKKIAAYAAIGASIFLILFSLVPIYFGIKAKMIGITVQGSPLIPVIGNLAGEFILVLATCAIVAAITSTADSLLCAISSNIAQDFKPAFLQEKNSLSFSKWVTLITGIVAIIASYLVPQNIISILKGSYEISVSCLLVPLLFSYFKKDLNKNAALGSIAMGAVGLILFRMYPISFPREIVTLSMSLAGYALGNTIKTK